MPTNYKQRCRQCGRAFESTRYDALHCSAACRAKRNRIRHARRLSGAQDLLARQSAALASGADPVILSQLNREACRLLGQ